MLLKVLLFGRKKSAQDGYNERNKVSELLIQINKDKDHYEFNSEKNVFI
jgi:hypothetical protein